MDIGPTIRYLPLNLDVRGRPVLFVGGGRVALRKCRTVLAAGAVVTVVAPALDSELGDLAAQGQVRHLARPYRPGDLAGFSLAYAATSDPSVNRAVAAEAADRHVLVEVVDAPELGNVTSPSVVMQGGLLLTVSTGGAAPAFAGALREELEERFGPEYGSALRLLGAVREKLLTERSGDAYNKQILSRLARSGLPTLFRHRDLAAIDRLLHDLIGPGFSLVELGIPGEDTP